MSGAVLLHRRNQIDQPLQLAIDISIGNAAIEHGGATNDNGIIRRKRLLMGIAMTGRLDTIDGFWIARESVASTPTRNVDIDAGLGLILHRAVKKAMLAELPTEFLPIASFETVGPPTHEIGRGQYGPATISLPLHGVSRRAMVCRRKRVRFGCRNSQRPPSILYASIRKTASPTISWMN